MHVVFRFDGGARIGTGHVMRCLTLAQALQTHGARISFLGQPETLAAIACYQADAECHCIAAGLSEQEDATACGDVIKNFATKPDWLIVDHYGLGNAWEMQMRPAVGRIMAIDDLVRTHDCDVVLDSNLPATEALYWEQVPVHCQRLLGPGYALLRQSFCNAAVTLGVRKTREHASRVFICFGGADPYGVTLWAVHALAELKDAALQVDVVVGRSYPQHDALQELAAQHPHWSVWVDPPHLETLMMEADIAIGAGGGMTWERAALGLPSLVVSIADNQLHICAALAAKKVIAYLGPYGVVTAQALLKAATELLRNRLMRETMARAACEVVNLHGAQRVAQVLRACN